MTTKTSKNFNILVFVDFLNRSGVKMLANVQQKPELIIQWAFRGMFADFEWITAQN